MSVTGGKFFDALTSLDTEPEPEPAEAAAPDAPVESEEPAKTQETEDIAVGDDNPHSDAPVERAPAEPEEAPVVEEAPKVPVEWLRAAIESVLMVVDAPVTEIELATACQCTSMEVSAVLHELAEAYRREGRGFELREAGGGWRFWTSAAYADVVERFVRDGQQAKLTQAALETLAVVAYRQPVTRSRVAAVRGVNVDGVMRTLLTRGLVEDAGTEEGSGATLYRTTGYFLDRLGIDSLDELPELAPFLPGMDALDDVEMPGSR
ncbi:MAG: SMC-Scp complex subunit ScpB [Sporichthyaceae bacterium]